MIRTKIFLKIVYTVPILFCMFGCVNKARFQEEIEYLDKSLNQIGELFNLKDISYLIAFEDNITHQKIAYTDRTVSMELFWDLMDDYRLPIILQRMIKKSIINEDQLLSDYFDQYRNTSLTIKDLLRTSLTLQAKYFKDSDMKVGLMRSIFSKFRSGYYNHELPYETYPWVSGKKLLLSHLLPEMFQQSKLFDMYNPILR